MQHRHLNHQDYSLAAIDDIIERGKRHDWAELRTALLADPTIRSKVLQICQTRISDPYAQRYHFWRIYAEQQHA